MQLNNNNFFRWYTGSAIDDTVNIPRIGNQDGCRKYLPTLVPGETVGLFINLNLPFIDDDAVSNLHLRIVGGIDIGAVFSKTPGYRLYTMVALPTLPYGDYQFEVYNTATNARKCISNYFRVNNGEGTSLVAYRNSRNTFSFDYENAPDFYNRFRLRLSVAQYSAEGGADQIQSVSTGRRRNLNGNISKPFQLSTYYFDDGAHEAAIAMVEHDDLQINGRAYIKKSVYNPSARVNSNLSIGQIEVYEQAYSQINKYGIEPIKRKQAKVLTIATTPVQISVYTINDILVATYQDIVYDEQVPHGGYIRIAGTGSAQVAYVNINGEITRSTVSLPVTLQQSDIFGVDYAIAIGSYAPVAQPAKVTLLVKEQTDPQVDANGLIYINGVEQTPAQNISGSRVYTVPAGSAIDGISFCETVSDAANPKIHLEIRDENDNPVVPFKTGPGTPGTNLTSSFTAAAGKSYTVFCYSDGV